jgi:DNA polymerase I-like protein with 3'-5' exonuclease and polymerase domains
MLPKGKFVYSVEQLLEEVGRWNLSFPVVADVETFGNDPKNGKLLGIAFCSTEEGSEPFYVYCQEYRFETSTWYYNDNWYRMAQMLRQIPYELVGHGYAYDKLWIDHVLRVSTRWSACTRLMWHLSSAPSGPRPYGLKDAQVEILGWAKRGDDELESQVRRRGGKPGRDVYLGDREVLVRYACSDARSTALVYNHLKGFFDKHDYWWMLEDMVEYSWLLQENTTAGIRVDEASLSLQVESLAHTKAAYGALFIEASQRHVEALERQWKEDRAAKYLTEAGRAKFLRDSGKYKRFNLSSDKDKRELFFGELKLPVVVETEGGLPSTSMEAIKASTKDKPELKELVDAYEQTESAETLLNSFAKPWLASTVLGRLHPRFNPCGTVSYRLSGFKPYLLNAPFDERELMSCLRCDEGWEGLHADFVSVEPAVTAHYSQDPSLLKVFRDGKGDVYLDLAKTLFPNDKGLAEGYDSSQAITTELKERFRVQRKVAKIIQLAVQYTGTKYTVHKNLSMEGIPSTLASADRLVKGYWVHFAKVAAMNEALFQRYAKNGMMLRNIMGRIIRVPSPRYKDLPNRFIQSSAHDLLTYWVLNIARMVKERGLRAKPILIDCHDSTSWQCPHDEIEKLEVIFKEALYDLNESVKMSVPVKIDAKRFVTLAGLKNKE